MKIIVGCAAHRALAEKTAHRGAALR
jgi:hypothetical protein